LACSIELLSAWEIEIKITQALSWSRPASDQLLYTFSCSPNLPRCITRVSTLNHKQSINFVRKLRGLQAARVAKPADWQTWLEKVWKTILLITRQSCKKCSVFFGGKFRVFKPSSDHFWTLITFVSESQSQNVFILGRYLLGYWSSNNTGIHFGTKWGIYFQRQVHRIPNTWPLYWRAGMLEKLLFRSSLGTEIFFKGNLFQHRTRHAFVIRSSCVLFTSPV
jgi:hypothetical protein